MLRKGVEQKMTLAEASLVRVQSQFDMLYVDNPEDSAFYFPFKNMTKFSGAEHMVRAIRNEAKKIITEEVIPAYRKLNDFFTNEYLPNARPLPGMSLQR